MSSGAAGRGGVTPSRPLLDRLCFCGDGSPPSYSVTREEYIAVIARDVEDLLNTRSPFPEDSEVEGVVAYGLPDSAALCPTSEADLRELERLIADTLERFESRLRDIDAEASTGRFPGQTSVTIRARLVSDGSEFTRIIAV